MFSSAVVAHLDGLLDRAEADQWWADLVGDVDPMVDIWAAEMDENGFPIGDPAGIAASVTVSNVDQGCYGVTGSLRATFDSLMNNSIPVAWLGESEVG